MEEQLKQERLPLEIAVNLLHVTIKNTAFELGQVLV